MDKQSGNFKGTSRKQVDLYDELPIWSAPFGLLLLEHIRLRRNITALDIGFGTGFPLTELAMRLGRSCRVYGIDPWEEAVRRAESKISLYRIENITIIRGVAEHIPLADNSVDLIVSNNGINNVADLPGVISECSRIMRKEGQFLITMNLNSSMTEFYEIMEKVLKSENMVQEIEKMQQHIYEKRKPLSEVRDLLEKNDFLVSQLHQDHFEYRFADGTTLFQHYFIRLAFLESWKSIVPLGRQKDIFSTIEKIMNERAVEAGFFKLSIPYVLIDSRRK
jgi:arsenite methyltransferase